MIIKNTAIKNTTKSKDIIRIAFNTQNTARLLLQILKRPLKVL